LREGVRILRRGGPLLLLLVICFPLLLLLRLPEAGIWGLHRPVTPHITRFVCVCACRLIGLRRDVRGTPMEAPGAYVSNHISWLDIFVLNASKRVYFVAKSEVRGWSGIGWLARGTGTVFIHRDRRHAKAQTRVFEDRLIAGHHLLFFPEGTSTDGQQVLPFKPTLFEAFFAPRLRDRLAVQPISLRYDAPEGEDPRFYGWWGDMEFGPSLVQLLAAPRQGVVHVVYHSPLAVAQAENRKTLAQQAATAVRLGVERGEPVDRP
jgi:1-acyl-sn-glycerol-3-phosphate acyltransferase